MPLSTEKLNKDSSKEHVRDTVSDCIRMAIKEGRPHDQAVAMCMESARRSGANVPYKKVKIKKKK
jgi:hypothetical protein